MACVHGNDPASCVICQALDIGAPGQATTTRATRRHPHPDGAAHPPVEVADTSGSGGGVHVGRHVAVLVGVLVLAALSFWVVTSLLFAVLRLVELVVVAGVAAVVGYRIGRSRSAHRR